MSETFETFTVKVKVNRNRTPQEAFGVTGCWQYTDCEVMNRMPKGEGDEVEVVFFRPDLSNCNGYISDDDLEKEFDLRGLKPADPISVARVNEADFAFVKEKPHATHWRDNKGNWCYVMFDYWYGHRNVYVCSDNTGYSNCWFAGVRK